MAVAIFSTLKLGNDLENNCPTWPNDNCGREPHPIPKMLDISWAKTNRGNRKSNRPASGLRRPTNPGCFARVNTLETDFLADATSRG